jgi:hypothetical protein
MQNLVKTEIPKRKKREKKKEKKKKRQVLVSIALVVPQTQKNLRKVSYLKL